MAERVAGGYWRIKTTGSVRSLAIAATSEKDRSCRTKSHFLVARAVVADILEPGQFSPEEVETCAARALRALRHSTSAHRDSWG